MLRKILFAIPGVLVLLAVAALVAPSFIDWNAYKGQIAQAARDATGRDLVIDGDISAALLPSPALSVGKARLRNARGAKAPDMVSFTSLSVGVALWPLLQGEVRVSAVTLVDPVIELERLGDGAGNWEFRPGGASAAPATSAPSAGAGQAAVRFDRVVLKNGRVVYRDAKAGTFETIERLNAELSAESLSGPFAGRADLVARSVPMAMDFKLGLWGASQPTPIVLALDLMDGKAKANFTGSLSTSGPGPKVTGRMKGESGDLAGALAAFGMAPTPVLARPLAVEAQIEASAAQATVKDIRVALGDIAATGAVSVVLSERPRIEAALNVGAIDLDRLLATAGVPGIAPASGALGAPPPLERAPPAPGKPAAPATAAPSFALPAPSFALPADATARLEVTFADLTWRDGAVRQLKLQAGLADGAFTIERLGALLPGGAEIKLSGRLTAVRNEPRFAGRLDAGADNLRALLGWLKVEPAGLPADRLRKLRLAAQVRYGDQAASINDIDLRLDSFRLTGALAYGTGPKATFGADVAIDSIDLDAYMPAPAPAPGSASAPAGAAGGGGGGSALPDGNLRLKVGQLIWQGRPAKDIDIDAGVRSGALDLKRASVGDFAGANVSVSGRVEGLAGTPRFDLKLNGGGKDVVQIARALGMDYRPAASNFGGVRVAAAIKGDARSVQVADLKASFGPANVEGDLALRLDKARPHLTAKLAASEILIDLFLPMAAVATAPRALAAGAPAVAAPAAGAGRWSRDPIDLGFLHLLDADVTLAARGLQYADYSFKEPRVELALANGALELKKLSGRLFGGVVEVKARVAAGDVANVAVEMSLVGADLKQALVTALQMDRVAGSFGLNGRFETRGNSQADMVRALNGSAAIEAGEGMVTGIDLKRLSDRLKQLDQITDFVDLVAGAMSAGQTRLLNAKGTWTAERGVFRSTDTVATLDGAEATVNGSIDLPNWQLDIASRMRLSEHPKAPPVGIDLRGPIDRPARDVKTRELETYVAERVGGAVLRRVLKDRLPGGAPATGAEPAPGTPPGQPATKPASPAEQLLRGLLKGLPQPR